MKCQKLPMPDYHCNTVLTHADNLGVAELANTATARAACEGENRDRCERNLIQDVANARAALDQALSRIFRERSEAQRECRRARGDAREIAADLPPDCLSGGKAKSCLTEREKCRNVRQRLGTGAGLIGLAPNSGALAITQQFQTQLVRDCPQAAAAKYDNDNERLRDVTGDFEEAQQEGFNLQKQLQEGVTQMQNERLALDADIQNNKNQMARSAHDFDARVREMSDQLSGQAAGLAAGAAGINKQIREKVTELETLQSEDNEELDQARVAYQEAINAIFSECQAQAKDAVEKLRGELNRQRASGKAAKKVEDATQQNKIDKLRDAAIRAYARCRNSSDTLIRVQRAKRQYQLVERAQDRKQQEIFDEINSLTEQHKTLGGQAHGISESVNQAYLSLEREHFDNLEILTQEMQLKNLEKQGLSATFNEQQRQLQQQLFSEVSRAGQLNGELAALKQAVEGAGVNTAFGNLEYDDYRRYDEYDQELISAREVCCIPGLQENPQNQDFCPGSGRSPGSNRGVR